MRDWIRSHVLSAYFLMAFGWSWTWWLGLLFATPAQAFLSGNLPPLFFVFALLGGAGPSLAGIVVSLLAGGRQEMIRLFSNQDKPGVQPVWWVVVALIVPFLVVTQTIVHAMTGRTVSFQTQGMMLVMGFIWPVFSSLGEEIGWRGYALPRMLDKHNPLAASLLLGFIWGVWHLPADYIAYQSYGWLFVPFFFLVGPLTLTAHSVMMTYLYLRTNRRLAYMVLYHYTITMTGILSPSVSFAGQVDDVLKTAVSVLILLVPAIGVCLLSPHMRLQEPEQVKTGLFDAR